VDSWCERWDSPGNWGGEDLCAIRKVQGYRFHYIVAFYGNPSAVDKDKVQLMEGDKFFSHEIDANVAERSLTK
jgi:hypothetical protein